MSIKTTALLVMMLMVSGCRNNPERITPVLIQDSCLWVKPIYLTDSDINSLDIRTKRAILAHNETWQANCQQSTGKVN